MSDGNKECEQSAPGHKPTSEVSNGPNDDKGSSEGQQSVGVSNNDVDIFMRLLRSAASGFQSQVTSVPVPGLTPTLIRFDPEDADADIEGWCNVNEVIIKHKKLEGTDLLLALTHALRGRAASCLTKIKTDCISWENIKELLLSKFSKPMLMQDYFDRIIKFQLNNKETAADAAVRLWQIIETIPSVDLPENVITGFVISVLSNTDANIRRELNAHIITSKSHLCRVLRGVSVLKRKSEDVDHQIDTKRSRFSDSRFFSGACHRCGETGHKIMNCPRNRSASLQTPKQPPSRTEEKRPTPVTCFNCGKPGHLSTTCQAARTKQESLSKKDVNLCGKQAVSGELHVAETPQELLVKRYENCRAHQLVNAYRTHGHLKATIDNVEYRSINRDLKELQLPRYGLSAQDYVDAGIVYGRDGKLSVTSLVDQLEQIYCGPICYEFSYLETEAEREWFAQRVESGVDAIDNTRRTEIAKELLESQAWDKFLTVKYPTVKRYCGEGAESLLTFFSTLYGLTTAEGVQHVVLSMAHRGKLNALTGVLKCPPVKIFHKFSGQPEFPVEAGAACDISTHLSASVDIVVNDKSVRFSLLNNPSHLEAANPVSMGKARSKQLQLKEGDYSADGSSRFGDKVMNVQIHGDAAFTGQGVNQETLMLSRAPHFNVGGSIHVVVNNQVGFTLPALRGRSCRYVTDLAKAIAVPVIHVNGDYPELVQKATNIAFEYQRRFRKDVFLDYNCFRRWGHNELDDPTFTNPLLYKTIHNRKSIPDVYAEKLVSEGVLTEDDVKNISTNYTKYLQAQFETVSSYKPEVSYYQEQWASVSGAPQAVETWNTGVDNEVLKLVGRASVITPSEFNIHPHLAKTHVKNRISKLTEEKGLDWATAEALALGSLLMEGVHVRLSGEDVGRGTFSHRHVMLVDQNSEDIYIPLNHIHDDQKAFLEVANSILSEEAVLGFEYGMAYDSPDHLCLWEAQFGDFYNGAQIIVDAFIASGESKWMRSNGLVMLLPHGYDGAASEHSSCRVERFLQLTDSREAAPDSENVCLHVANPTTPAQYFHLLRRQMVRNYRKPLVIVAPKLLLRLADAVSSLEDFGPGTHFLPVIGDPIADPLKVKRVILVSGKHYYELHKERVRARIEDVAIVRVEGLSPFPLQALQRELDKYGNARKFIWSQEEHRNMGAWTFVKPRFENLLGRKLVYAGRAEAPTPAVGASVLHRQEVEHVLREPLYNIK